MEYDDLIELAQDAFPVVADIAARLGADKKERDCGLLGGLLCSLTYALGHPSSPDQESIFQRRIAKLLREIESLCTASSNHCSCIYPMLHQAADRSA